MVLALCVHLYHSYDAIHHDVKVFKVDRREDKCWPIGPVAIWIIKCPEWRNLPLLSVMIKLWHRSIPIEVRILPMVSAAGSQNILRGQYTPACLRIFREDE